MKLIDKDTLVAEIERRIKEITKEYQESKHIQYTLLGKINALENLLHFLYTLEVKEVDLEKVHYKPLDEDFERDAVSFCFDTGLNTTPYIAKIIAKHFFELGLKAQKGE